MQLTQSGEIISDWQTEVYQQKKIAGIKMLGWDILFWGTSETQARQWYKFACELGLPSKLCRDFALVESFNLSEANNSQAMVYQYQAKQTVMAFFGLPFCKVDLPFADWMNLRKRYETESGKQL